MSSRYNIFDELSFPVAAVDRDSNITYSNSEFKRLYSSGSFKGFQDSSDEKRLFLCDDGGDLKCFQAQLSQTDGETIWSFTDVTGLLNRKSMIETSAIDEKHITKHNIRKIIEKNKRLADVVDLMDSGVMIEGASGNIIQLNSSFLRIIYGSDDFTIKEDYDASDCHDKLADLVLSHDYYKIMNDIVKNHPDSPYTDELTFKDGRVFVRTYHPLFIDGRSKGRLWKFRDITTRKQLEKFRSELESVITALEACPAVGLSLTFKGFTFVNRGMLNMLGTDRETFKTKGISSFISGNITPSDGNIIERLIPIKRHDKTNGTAAMICDTVKVGQERVTVVSLRDITDQTCLEDSLRENERKFRTIFENNSAVMLIFDPISMEILDANTSAQDFYGYSIDELTKKKMCEITMTCSHTECRVIVENILGNGSASKLAVKTKLSDGTIHDVELKMTPLEVAGKTVFFVIVEDISDRIRYQQELLDMNQNLQKVISEEIEKRRRNEELLMEKMRLAEIGEMIGSIAHQWRQPLNTLGLLIQDIADARDFGELSDDYVSEFVTSGMKQIDFMSKTIDDFRDFFKPSKKMEIFDIKDSVAQVLSIVKPQLKNKNISCVVVCSCGVRERIESDTETLTKCAEHDMRIKGYQNEFKQVILNLISNSRDAVVNKPVRLIKIRLTVDERFVILSVQDTGGGIPNELLGRIFEPYFTTKGDKGGTGIGLYMSKAIIEENMKGSLNVNNTEDGCRFTITMGRVKA